MPTLSIEDRFLLGLSTSEATELASFTLPTGKYGRGTGLTTAELIQRVVADRFKLSASHLSTGDELLSGQHFRLSVGRHYYAMYHAARAVTFGMTKGDDHEQHSVLPRHLPAGLTDRAVMEAALMDARLLRNKADYDPYPIDDAAWEIEARQLSVDASTFSQAMDNFAASEGLIP